MLKRLCNKIYMNKKADFGWENIAKILIALTILIILLILVSYLSGVGKDKIAILSNYLGS